ncbi:MAG: hypothetical protein JXR49_02610 [Acidobacteria bacterium]|nr:hypothetical protein [Acidobacteriota bacterium]
MNIIDCLYRWDRQQAIRDRSARIREHQEEVVSMRPKLDIRQTRTFSKNGRIVIELTINGSREYGQGFSYKLICGVCA